MNREHALFVLEAYRLREEDVDNLKCGRITQFALMRAMQQLIERGIHIPIPSTSRQNVTPQNMGLLAEELNELLEIGRTLAAFDAIEATRQEVQAVLEHQRAMTPGDGE